MYFIPMDGKKRMVSVCILVEFNHSLNLACIIKNNFVLKLFLTAVWLNFTTQLMLNTPLNLTEISIQLNYSSVAHLSTQFKHTTGMTPSAFQKIILKRKELSNKKQ